MESNPGEDAVKIVEKITRYSEYCINLVKQKQSLNGLTPISLKSSTVGKMLSNSMAYYRDIASERKSQLMTQTLMLSY